MISMNDLVAIVYLAGVRAKSVPAAECVWMVVVASCNMQACSSISPIGCHALLSSITFPLFPAQLSRGRHIQSHAFRFQVVAYHFDGISVVEGR
jgi:hypothetical protein